MVCTLLEVGAASSFSSRKVLGPQKDLSETPDHIVWFLASLPLSEPFSLGTPEEEEWSADGGLPFHLELLELCTAIPSSLAQGPFKNHCPQA